VKQRGDRSHTQRGAGRQPRVCRRVLQVLIALVLVVSCIWREPATLSRGFILSPSAALVLLAVFGSLRWGELAALRRCDIDVRVRTVRIARQLTEQRGGGLVFGQPKSEAGRRTVAIPELITPDLAVHLVTYARPGDEGLVFTSAQGALLRHSNFCRRVWRPAFTAVGLPPVHFHDLRHSGNQLAADAVLVCGS
jgi:integrase